MGFRFRRSIRLLPGIRLNLGKTGSSVSIGGRGATVNFGSRGTRTTVGLPGTGLSYSTFARRKPNPDEVATHVAQTSDDGGESRPKVGFFGALFHLLGALFELAVAAAVLVVQLGVIAALVGGVAWVVWRAVAG